MSSQIAPAPTDQVAGSHPVWRRLLEARWQRRLITLTELSLAYHDAGERPDGHGPDDRARTSQASRALLRKATVARRALQDTEEALARLSAGRYGRCEQCTATITAAELRAEPEIRYCTECVRGL